eukprot:jgi/Ulvmu1/267/UM001_0271.1
MKGSEMIEAVVVYVNVAAYAACYMAQIPVLPFLIHQIGAEMSAYGLLQTVFSAIQTVGGLISGVLMDKYGAKIVLLASFAASAATYGLTAAAWNMPILYVSTVPTLFQHAVLAVRVWVSSSSSLESRASMLGYIGLAYSVGQVAGPIIGGQVGHILGPRGPAYLAMWGSVLSTLSIAAFLRGSSATKIDAEGDVEDSKKRRSPSLSDVFAVCAAPAVPALLSIKFLAGLAGEIFQTTLPLALKENFQLSLAESSYVMSLLGVLSMFVHGVLIKWLVQKFSETKIVLGSCVMLLLSFIALALRESFIWYVVLSVPIYAATSVFSIVNTAQLTKAVLAEQLGSMLAVDMAIGSITRMLSPVIGTTVLQRHGVLGVGVSSSTAVAVALLFAQLNVVNAKSDGLHKDA